MKKSIMICTVIAIVAIAAAAVLTASGVMVPKSKLPSVSNSATIAQAADFYADVVELTKNEKNMEIKTVTTVTFKDFDCPNENLRKMILKYLGYEVGASETKTDDYSFKNGVDSAGATPFNVIQPAGSNIEKGNYVGLTLNSVDKDRKHTAISFTLDEESADFLLIAEAYASESPDFSVFAPRHFNYIDVDGIVLYLRDMLDFNFSGDDAEYAVAEIETAEITLGKTEIRADVNANALLTEVDITVPVYFDGTVRLMTNNKRITAKLEVSRHYTFTYNGENEK